MMNNLSWSSSPAAPLQQQPEPRAVRCPLSRLQHNDVHQLHPSLPLAQAISGSNVELGRINPGPPLSAAGPQKTKSPLLSLCPSFRTGQARRRQDRIAVP